MSINETPEKMDGYHGKSDAAHVFFWGYPPIFLGTPLKRWKQSRQESDTSFMRLSMMVILPWSTKDVGNRWIFCRKRSGPLVGTPVGHKPGIFTKATG